jgi:hypothetical protein
MTRAQEPEAALPDADLVPVFGIVWIASLVRVAGAVAFHETFGTEQTLALFCVLLLPWLLLEPLGTLARRSRHVAVPETEASPPKPTLVHSRSRHACDERRGPLSRFNGDGEG